MVVVRRHGVAIANVILCINMLASQAESIGCPGMDGA